MNLEFSTDEHLTHRQMKKLLSLIQDLHDQYNHKFNQIQGMPTFSFPKIHHGKGERFQSSLYKGTLFLEAESPKGAVYGMTQLYAAALSGYLPDYLESASSSPYPLRPLWLCGSHFSLIQSEVGLFLPSFLLRPPEESLEEQEFFKAFCIGVLEKGYNAIVFGHRHVKTWPSKTPLSIVSLKKLCQAFHAYGLKVLIRPIWYFLEKEKALTCPVDPMFASYIQKELGQLAEGEIDGLIWESQIFHSSFMKHPLAEDALEAEVMQKEMDVLEKALPQGILLLYYLSSYSPDQAALQARRFPALCHRAGKKTVFVFSALAGDPCQDHLPLNPLWEVLRKLPDPVRVPLLPILNIGAIQHGEGLWPALPIDLIGNVIGRFYRHCFAGGIALANRLPMSYGLLAYPLWVWGQILWQKFPLPLLKETWFQAYRPDLFHPSLFHWLEKVRLIAIELGYLKALSDERKLRLSSPSSEESRLHADNLLAQLNDLQLFLQKEKPKAGRNSYALLQEYFRYFVRDARRMILYFLQTHHLPLSAVLTGQDLQPAFWSEAIQGPGQGIRNRLDMHFFEQPQVGESGSTMEQIFIENSFLS